jgi:hypothetical protein
MAHRLREAIYSFLDLRFHFVVRKLGDIFSLSNPQAFSAAL